MVTATPETRSDIKARGPAENLKRKPERNNPGRGGDATPKSTRERQPERAPEEVSGCRCRIPNPNEVVT
jgi:hypothetical protein